ncbi:hypothetical protein EZJ49_14855 [Bdellovibrio bacteriovorus]|uniref:hypothetical protein n=1 Tax=Bdellovibrio bacteriovorus TaxID=959 RepID=UPI0021D39A9C|nr:hypothetical protein [Bdellovibrio bacteriovorus]UXR64346.1 hypothetical protein EZJ49_14855 [Bdellovibrio bacteriovorus]
MKNLIFFLSVLWPVLGQAQVLIQGPGSSPKEFESFLSLNPRAQSFQRFVIEEMQSQPQQEQKIFALADLIDIEISSGLEQLDKINREAALSTLSLQFLKDLLARWQSVTSANKAMKTAIHQLSCKMNFLSGENTASSECPLEPASLSELRTKNSWAETLLVESSAYSLEAGSRLLLVASARYHFTLLSNTHNPVSFYGTYAELLSQNLKAEPLVSGSCKGFHADIDSMNLLNQGSVFWNAQCVRRLNEGQDSDLTGKSWLQRNKTWLYPTAALLFGGGIYVMRGKKLVIDASSFQ